MTLTQMLAQLRIYIDDRNADLYSDADLTLVLNQGQLDVERLISALDQQFFTHVETFTIAADSDAWEVALPADCRSIISVERIDVSPPVLGKYIEFRQRHTYATINLLAADFKWYLRGTRLGVISPQNAFNIRVYYTRILAALSQGTDVSEVPGDFHNLICLLGAKRILGPIGRWSAALQDLENTQTAQIPTFLGRRQTQDAGYINVTGYDTDGVWY